MEEAKKEKRERLMRSILARNFYTGTPEYNSIYISRGRDAFLSSNVHTRPTLNFGRGPMREDRILRVLYNIQGCRTISDEENRLLCLEKSNPVTDEDKRSFYDGCGFLESKLRKRTMTEKEYFGHLNH